MQHQKFLQVLGMEYQRMQALQGHYQVMRQQLETQWGSLMGELKGWEDVEAVSSLSPAASAARERRMLELAVLDAQLMRQEADIAFVMRRYQVGEHGTRPLQGGGL